MTNLNEDQIKFMANTFRLVANALGSAQRKTCLDRDIMECWNWCVDALNDVDTDTMLNNNPQYRVLSGQVPVNIKNK